jgi:hypothetical protein
VFNPRKGHHSPVPSHERIRAGLDPLCPHPGPRVAMKIPTSRNVRRSSFDGTNSFIVSIPAALPIRL